jgi:hypothetical protein
MHRTSIALVALLGLACSTYQVDDCRPACGPSHQTIFAHCVANGQADCPAGNRRCCALLTNCVGRLDDQTVETTRTDCPMSMSLVEDACYPPCDGHDESEYELCAGMGNGVCAIGDEECCALASDCIGDLGPFEIDAVGCCTDASDCGGDVCDATYTCVPGPGCGDGMITGMETCDDGTQDFDPECAYGPMSCLVCTDTCTEQPGTPRYCGDETIDPEETCDPPDGEICDDTCHDMTLDPCFDGFMDGNETDMDCGGTDCAPCPAGRHCLVASDCEAFPECGGTPTCGVTSSVCMATELCSDPDVCTRDACEPGTGCGFHLIDDDFDGEGPRDLDCGLDCNDLDPNIGPTIPEICDRIDQDCDDLIDESCT